METVDFIFSSKNNAFFKKNMIDSYLSNGWVIDDAVDVSNKDYEVYNSTPPTGKTLSSRGGMPCWIDLPSPPNSVLLKKELEIISSKYQEDMNELNGAYLAAIVSDGPGEPAKKQAVRDAITARKAQYAAEKEAARLKYPV